MIPTPDLSHLSKSDYEYVYEPAEDTFILLDALEQEANELKSLSPFVCLEIGSGSGCVSSFTASILGPSAALYICTDINAHASRCTSATGRQNKVALEPITASLAQPLLCRLRHSVDLLIFNPPYVPTIVEEVSNAQRIANIEGSWAGGTNGMHITDGFLQIVKDLLSPKGRFYLVAIDKNDIPGVRRRMLQEHGLQSEIVLQRQAGREHLFVVCFVRLTLDSEKQTN